VCRFKLNHNSNRLLPGERNFSVWVGDLTPEIDDLQLYRFFSARFKTIVSAKGKPTIPSIILFIQSSCRFIYIFIYTSVLTCSLFHPFFQVLTKRLLSLSVRFFLHWGKKFSTFTFKQKEKREKQTR
jgi:RNA recognition motif-containing protein